MTKTTLSLNDAAWEKLFVKYDILKAIRTQGSFRISGPQIKEFREPRLMAKFDHSVNLPKLFADNKLAILPVTRGDYVISDYAAYHSFEVGSASVTRVSLPDYIQSLNENKITSEAIALNCAAAAGILEDFLEDDHLLPTVSGRMGSGEFAYNIASTRGNTAHTVSVNRAQIEIDAAFEGRKSLALIEAKRELADDFLVRQLYYPYRAWRSRITKPVRPIFMIYSNGIYRLYEYKFMNPDSYNSLQLIKQKNYSLEEMDISAADIQDILSSARVVAEPKKPFPQADSFERIINLCELLNGQVLSCNDVTDRYAFDARQTRYYTDAADYLGLLEKCRDDGNIIYRLTSMGRKILGFRYRQRQLTYCNLILSHAPFAETLKEYFTAGFMPDKEHIIRIMKNSNLYNVQSDNTYARRASTIRGWINWIVGLINV